MEQQAAQSADNANAQALPETPQTITIPQQSLGAHVAMLESKLNAFSQVINDIAVVSGLEVSEGDTFTFEELIKHIGSHFGYQFPE